MAEEDKKGANTKGFSGLRRLTSKVTQRAAKDQENGARRDALEQLFHDFNRSKVDIFWMNFFRGIFFGIGSFLGATLGIALLVAVLSLFADLPGAVGDFIRFIVDTVNGGSRRE